MPTIRKEPIVLIARSASAGLQSHRPIRGVGGTVSYADAVYLAESALNDVGCSSDVVLEIVADVAFRFQAHYGESRDIPAGTRGPRPLVDGATGAERARLTLRKMLVGLWRQDVTPRLRAATSMRELTGYRTTRRMTRASAAPRAVA